MAQKVACTGTSILCTWENLSTFVKISAPRDVKITNLFEGNNIISDQYEEEEETSLNLLRLSLRLR